MLSALTFQLSDHFSALNALNCARASQLSYSQYSVRAENTDTEALVWEFENVIVVAFRGSSSVRDFITDAECAFMKVDGGEVHSGFWVALMSIMAMLREKLHGMPMKPLIVTGHSLGGALAMLFGWRWDLAAKTGEWQPVDSVYTFGQPRVGNAAFAASYDAALGARTWRVVDQEDVVPRVPFWTWGYRHCAQEAFLPSFGGVQFNPGFRLRLVSDFLGLWRAWRNGALASVLSESLRDHHIERYLERLG